MYSRIKSFFYRHRRKFIVGGIFVSGAMLATRYAQKKFIEWQEKQAKELFESTRKLHHFESTERTCNKTIISLSCNVKQEIRSKIDVLCLIEELKSGSANKAKIWNELKVNVFAQHSALMYSGLMLTVVLRVQLNILGGYMCREAVESDLEVPSSIQNKYLSLCQYFLNEGCVKLCDVIKGSVEHILEGYTLKRVVSIRDIEDIFWSIQFNINSATTDPVKKFISYVLPPISELDLTEPLFNNMVTETYQVLETEEVLSLLSSSLSSGYSNSLDRIAEKFNPEKFISVTEGSTSNSIANGQVPYLDVNKVTMPLARFIPVLDSVIQDVLGKDDCGPWIQQFITMQRLKTFGANIYEAFSYTG